MTDALSLYLDALRFGAALTVFVSHYSTGRISGGLFWQFDGGRTAVLVFFVLSGFVIAWVSDTRERTLEEYGLSRVARLYSVIIPVFVLTAVLDTIGKAIDPRLYGPEWGHSMAHPMIDYVLSAVFLGESWTIRVLPGFNVPYWSLNYEAWYYVLFAAAIFLRGRPRIAVVIVAALLAGPRILFLLPVWLMGVAAWRWRAELPRQLGRPLVIVCLAGFIALEALGGERLFWHPSSGWLPPDFSAYDFVLGALVALFIVGLANVQLPMPRASVRTAGSRARRNILWALFAALPAAEFLRDRGAGAARRSTAPGPCFRSCTRRSARIGKPHRAPQRGAEGPTAFSPPHPARKTPATGGRSAAAFLTGHWSTRVSP